MVWFSKTCYVVRSLILSRLLAFQINRGGTESTVEPSPKSSAKSERSTTDYAFASDDDQKASNRAWWIESSLIFVCFALFSGQLPPDVNESHYLTKAKHFWNPNWCPDDIFLSSSFAHWMFFVGFGWISKFVSLSVFAWMGRIITWLMLAWVWQRLSWKLIPQFGMSIISAIFFLLLNDRFHLAGEWVVGGFEAKGMAYAFVLLGLNQMVSRNWKLVWPFLGLATALHVLVGGWALLAAGFAWLAEGWIQTKVAVQPIRFDRMARQLLPMTAGMALALVGIIPPLLADQSAPAELATAARMIYVNHRIAHHLTFDAFPTIHVARFGLVIVFWLLLNRWISLYQKPMAERLRPIYLFGVGSLLISLGGLVLSGIAEENQHLAEKCAGLLRFYWFRLSDFAVPMGVALATCSLIGHWINIDRRIAIRFCCTLFLTCIVGATSLVILERYQDPRPRADKRSLPFYPDSPDRTQETYKNWLKVCQWIANETPSDAIFFTPAQQQTFKWYSGRTEVVCWKDVPQDSAGILEWKSRLSALYDPQRRYETGLMTYSDDQLRMLAKKYGATHMLVPQRHVDLVDSETTLKQVYPETPGTKSTYVVFEF